jgi:hypothetical protein
MSQGDLPVSSTVPKHGTAGTTTTEGEGQHSPQRFYVVTAIIALVIVAAGFGPAMIDTASRRAPLTGFIIAHGVMTLGWLALYLAQTVLVATGRVHLHRRLGTTGAVLAVPIILVGYQTTITMVRRGFDLSGDLLGRIGVPDATRLLGSTVFPLGGLVQFGVLVAVALLYRRRPEIHKRLMVLAVVILMAEPLAHLFGHFGIPLRLFGPAFSMLLFSHAIYDRITRGRMHPVSFWGGLTLSMVNLLSATVVRPSATWQQFVAWLAS